MIVCEGESDALAALTALRGAPEGFRDMTVCAVPGTGCPVDRVVGDLCGAEIRFAFLAMDAVRLGSPGRARAPRH